MSEPVSPTKPILPAPDDAALSQAFEALKTYDQGCGRAALLPIDDAVKYSLQHQSLSKNLEQRLVSLLQECGSPLARAYICAKLVMVGTDHSVSALASLLADPQLSHPALNTLQNIPGTAVTRALRQRLPTLEGCQKLAVIQSLGARCDRDAVRLLVRLLKDENPHVVAAAAGALGDIASTSAARALRAFIPHAPEALRSQVCDAALTCAEGLLRRGDTARAAGLYQCLLGIDCSEHVRKAASRGLTLVAGNR